VLEAPFLCVHGTPRRPINEYLFPEDANSSPGKMNSIFERIRQSGAHYCLVGHTHVPGVFTEVGDFYKTTEMDDGVWEFKPIPAEASAGTEGEASSSVPRAERLIINPGSVGQPRDLDPRASYAIIDAEETTDAAGQRRLVPRTVQFFRLEYDIAQTRAKIDAVAKEIATRSAMTRDPVLAKIDLKSAEPAGPWLDRFIEELETSLGRQKKDSPMHEAIMERINVCRNLKQAAGEQKDATTHDVMRMLLENDPLYRPEMERYNWLGARLVEGR
jgi:diadenosine tetraphosphatase ApaH/serine/threonine PP2A family protein phosphatase